MPNLVVFILNNTNTKKTVICQYFNIYSFPFIYLYFLLTFSINSKLYIYHDQNLVYSMIVEDNNSKTLAEHIALNSIFCNCII